MALINCPECGKQISDKAKACPDCGYPLIQEKKMETEDKDKLNDDAKMSHNKKAQNVIKEKVTHNKKKTFEHRKLSIKYICILCTVLVATFFAVYFLLIKLPKDKAYDRYVETLESSNLVIEEYNEKVDEYNNKANLIITANNELDEKTKQAETLINGGIAPYEGETLTTLNNTIKTANNNKVLTPTLKEKYNIFTLDEDLSTKQKKTIDKEITEIESVVESLSIDVITAEIDALVVPDYSEIIQQLDTDYNALNNSIAITIQVTNPSEDFIVKRLGMVEGIVNIAPVTEEHDPNGNLNKAGGYTSAVYFSSDLLNTKDLSGVSLIDEGTSAGGCIEVYSCEEDAIKRNDYLSAFDGSVISSGSHMVLGTIVIRTSDDLTASEQTTLTNSIIESLISIDVDFNNIDNNDLHSDEESQEIPQETGQGYQYESGQEQQETSQEIPQEIPQETQEDYCEHYYTESISTTETITDARTFIPGNPQCSDCACAFGDEQLAIEHIETSDCESYYWHPDYTIVTKRNVITTYGERCSDCGYEYYYDEPYVREESFEEYEY